MEAIITEYYIQVIKIGFNRAQQKFCTERTMYQKQKSRSILKTTMLYYPPCPYHTPTNAWPGAGIRFAVAAKRGLLASKSALSQGKKSHGAQMKSLMNGNRFCSLSWQRMQLSFIPTATSREQEGILRISLVIALRFISSALCILGIRFIVRVLLPFHPRRRLPFSYWTLNNFTQPVECTELYALREGEVTSLTK